MIFPKHLIAESGDRDLDARRAERLAWLEVQDAYETLATVPLANELRLHAVRRRCALAIDQFHKALRGL